MNDTLLHDSIECEIKIPTNDSKGPCVGQKRDIQGHPPLELGGGNRAPLDVGGTLMFPLEWRRVFRGLLELQQGCEGPFGSFRG